VRLALIPERNGRNVILQLEIAPAGLPSERLKRDLHIFLKPDGISDMPAVEPEARLPAQCPPCPPGV